MAPRLREFGLSDAGRPPEKRIWWEAVVCALTCAGLINPILFSTIIRLTDISRDIPTAISLFLMCLSVSTIFILSFFIRNRKFTINSVAIFLILFIFAYIFTSAIVYINELRYDYGNMWKQLAMSLIPALLFFAYYQSMQFKNISKCIIFAVKIIFLLSGISIGLEIAGIFSFESYGGRSFGFLGDSVAWLLSFCGVIFFSTRLNIYFFITCVFLITTQSRGAIVILLGAVVLIFLIGGGVSLRRRVAIVLTSAVFFSVVYFLMEDKFLEIADRFYEIDLIDNDRAWSIEIALSLFEQSPYYGLGFNAQVSFFSPYALQKVELRGFSTPVSTAFQVLSDGGMIAIFAYILLIIFVTIKSLKCILDKRTAKSNYVCKGAAAWLMLFLWLNHSAAWLIPGSVLSSLVFASMGMICGLERLTSAGGKPYSGSGKC